jgi:hypothetical protein
VLLLAACNYESVVEKALEELLIRGTRFDYLSVKSLAQPHVPAVPVLHVPEPDLTVYDRLIGGAR